jgi:hypothetical protein
MKHLFIPYELALKLKEKGFNEPCFGFYIQGVLHPKLPDSTTILLHAPLYQQVIDWFREKHDIFISPENRNEHLIVRGWNRKTCEHFVGDSNEPKEALNKAIEEALKLV